MRADLTGSELSASVAEDIGCQDVDWAHDQHDDASSDHYAPEWHAERLLRCRFLVHVAENAVAEEQHGETKHDEAGAVAEERPVARDVGFEERQFGKDQEACDNVSNVFPEDFEGAKVGTYH